MNYEAFDSSGTDDDLPPSHQDRFSRGGQSSGNGRPAPVPRKQNDMETQIHNIELEAYSSVLRAFKAQSDAITWEKESLITELRKELRISDEEHRELLSKVNADEIIQRIRKWRKTGELPLHEPRPSSTNSARNKKLKTSLSMGAPSPAFRSSLEPSLSILKRGSYSGDKGVKSKASSSQDIRWDDEDFEVSGKCARPGTGRGSKRCMSRSGAGGRGTTNGQSKQDFPISLNGNVKKGSAGIQIMHTGTLIKQVQKICNANHDPVVVEKAMSLLNHHEKTLIDAIAKLEEPSDNESD